jgi:hypothetical protein
MKLQRSRLARILGLVVLALATTGTAQPGTRVRLGGIAVGGGYFYGPGFWPYYPSYWGPYGAFYGPGDYGGYAYGPGLGEVRLRVEPAHAQVFLNGGYAGEADQRKSMWLEPGAYNLEIKAAGHETFSRKIYVLSGKSLRIDTELGPEPTTEKQP